MRAVLYSEYGPSSVLRIGERPKPEAKANEVVVRVLSVEVTKADCELRGMCFPVRWTRGPARLMFGWKRPKNPVLGSYFSGRVEEVGSSVTHVKVDDEVFGCSGVRFGAYAEWVCVSGKATLTEKPSNLSFAEAAAVPLGGLNAIHFMRRAEIRPGERILIIGAGGSIGSYALQIAKHRGAIVTAVDASHKLAWLSSLGADQTIDYTTADALASSGAYDIIFSTIAGDHYDRALRALTPGGRYLTANPRFFDLLRAPITNLLSNKRVVVAFAGETKAELEELRNLIERRHLKVPIDREFPLEQAKAAHERVETEQRLGSVVLTIET